MAFLVGDEEGAIVIEADAVRGAKSFGDNVGALAVGTHAQQRAVMRHERGQRVTGGLGVIEISRRIRLQAHREFVEVLGDLMVVVEVLDEVRLAIAIQVAEPHELVAASDEQFVATKLHAERLKESARDTPPAQRGGRSRHDAIHTPDVAVPSGYDGDLAVRREIKAAGPHPALPGILSWQRERVGDERAVRFAGHRSRRDFLSPTCRSTVGQRFEVERCGGSFHQRRNRCFIGSRNKEPRLRRTGEFRDPEAALFAKRAIAGERNVHRVRRDAQEQRLLRRTDIQRAGEDCVGAVVDPTR